MKNYKFFIFGFFLLFFLPFLAESQTAPPDTPAFPLPMHTEKIGERTEEVDGFVNTFYQYFSQLSSQEIIEFYRNALVEQGLEEVEVSPGPASVAVHFAKGKSRIVFVVLYIWNKPLDQWAKEDEGKTVYFLNVFDNRDVLQLANAEFKYPDRLSFAPVYPQAKQFCLRDEPSKWKVAAYLSDGEVEKIANFYMKEMPQYNWKFTGTNSYESNQNIVDALLNGDPNPKKLSGEEMMPGVTVDVKGATLTYAQGDGKRCAINIMQFRDPPDVLAQHRINPSAFKKYGNIYISLVVYDQ
ncbi:MAG: hypothetical protein WCI77_05635 [Candidatus Omnitrophota bacterium]